MITPSLEQFLRLAKKGTHVPLSLELWADMETPVSAFMKLTRGLKARRSFLLESVEGGERLGRYSYLGVDPSQVLEVTREGARLWQGEKAGPFSPAPDPLVPLERLLKGFRPVQVPGQPPFWGGALGYLGYDVVRAFEPVGDKNPDPLGFPEALHFLVDRGVAFDHVNHRMSLVALADCRDRSAQALKRSYAKAQASLRAMLKALQGPLPALPKAPAGPASPWTCNVGKPEYLRWVARSLDYIKAGDIFQIQIGRRLTKRTRAHAFSIYRELRGLNPSPYMFYFQDGERRLIGASPEVLVKVDRGSVSIRPIAGTRRRGDTPERDLELERELKADPKERAEHIMLVDLARNDIGRVAAAGTVKVDDLMVIERYSHVMHIVSDVRGELRKGLGPFDVLRASFPAGTVTGSPKIRSMQIIDELENLRRGPYAGCIGMMGFDGSLRLALLIRTLMMKGQWVSAQASAGIVADSRPELEYLETENKMRATVTAVDRAEGVRRP